MLLWLKKMEGKMEFLMNLALFAGAGFVMLFVQLVVLAGVPLLIWGLIRGLMHLVRS